MPATENPLTIKLRYQGRDVDEGTMPVEEVVSALQGFAGAYGKIADSALPAFSHQLRVSALREGSFEVAILAWIASDQAGASLKIVENLADAAKFVFGLLGKVIDAKKHTKSKPFEVKVEGSHNTVVLINAEGAALDFPREALEILTSKLVDGDLAKIASPLEEGRIESAQIVATGDDYEQRTTIASGEKGYFALGSGQETSSSTTISGTLISLNKETLKGTFKRSDGLKIPYKYVGSSPEGF